MTFNRFQSWCLALPGIAVFWQFFVGNWLNSPRCLTDAWYQFKGAQNAFLDTPYWAKYTLCVDPYWANQWLKNYAGGFVKRGFIGSLLNLFGDRFDLVLLNLFAFLSLLLISYSLLFIVARLLGNNSTGLVSMGISVLWLSSFGKVFSETAGDPLQIVLILWLLFGCMLSLLQVDYKLPDLVIDCVCSSLLLVSILIYEGSFLFLLIPFCFLGRRSWLWFFSLFIAILMVWSMSGSESLVAEKVIASSLVGFNSLNGLEVSYRAGGGIASQVSFMDNFWMELSRYKESPWSVLSELRGALAAFSIWLMFGSAFIFAGFEESDFAVHGDVWRFGRRFIVLVVLNLLVISPFLFVTHDWVRYLAVVSVLLLIVVSAKSAYFLGGSERLFISSRLNSRLFLIYSLTLGCISWRLGPFGVDLRTSLPADSRMPYTLLAVFAFCLGVALLRICFRRTRNCLQC